MITDFFVPQLNAHDMQELWFQQNTNDLLKKTFGNRIISRELASKIVRFNATRLSSVGTCEVVDKPETIDHLKNIRRVIADIPPQMLQSD